MSCSHGVWLDEAVTWYSPTGIRNIGAVGLRSDACHHLTTSGPRVASRCCSAWLTGVS